MEGLHEAQVLQVVHGPTGSGGSPFDDLFDLPGGRTILSISRISGATGLFWNTHALTIQFHYILDNFEEWTPGERGSVASLEFPLPFDISLGPTEVVESAKVMNSYTHELGRMVAGIAFTIADTNHATLKRTVEVGALSPEFLVNVSLPGRVICSRGRAGLVVDGIQFYHLSRTIA